MKYIIIIILALFSVQVALADNFEDIPGKLAIGANQAVRRNASDTAFEAYTITTPTPMATSTPLPTVAYGSVLFGDSAGQIAAEDKDKFTYDSTNNRLEVSGSLSAELLTNGTFTGGSSGWSLGSGWTYSSNSVSHSTNGTASLSQSLSIYVGDLYVVTYTISNYTAGTITPSLGGVTLAASSANGTYTQHVVATAATSISFSPSNTARFTIDDVSVKRLSGGTVRSGQLDIYANHGNSSPSTTRMISLKNAGGNTWIDFLYSGTLREAIGGNSSGGMDFYSSGGNYFAYYNGNSGLTSNSLFSYNYPSAFVHSGYGDFGSGVSAGSQSFPTSTFQNFGGSSFKVKRVTTSQGLDNTATHWLADASSAACTGTPTYTCSHWTNSSDCALRNSHGGCTWFAGNSCSTYNNEYGMSSCAGTSGCYADQNSCAGAGDQYSCESQDDSYGGNCTWSSMSNDCSSFDESTCASYSSSGCTSNYNSCTNAYFDCASYTDETACGEQSGNGCTWSGSSCEGGNWTSCSGGGDCASQMDESSCSSTSYFTSCSGTYYVDECTGNYYTGNCSGTYGAACQGTSTCDGVTNSTDCGNENGCTWQTAINLTLPDGDTCEGRTYWIKNDSATSADVNILPYSGQTVEKASSLTLDNYKDAVMLAYYKDTYSCSLYTLESQCTPTGCTKNYYNCSWDSMGSPPCTGDSSCEAVGDQSTCESTQYWGYCSGTEVRAKNWYIFGDKL